MANLSEAALFRALANPARLSILEDLRRGERPAGALGPSKRLSQPALSLHLGVLRRAGLVRARRRGRLRLYRLDPRGLRGVGRWTRRYERFWRGRLEALRGLVEDGERT